MQITAFDLAQRFVGVKELPGEKDNPFVMSMLQLDQSWPIHDEVPWCSAFVNYIAWLLRLPRSKSLSARSWLEVGEMLPMDPDIQNRCPIAKVGYDVAIFRRGTGELFGHVGFWGGQEGQYIRVLGGNQRNQVGLFSYPASELIGVRRLFDGP